MLSPSAVPDRTTLQAIAAVMNRETSYAGAPEVHFEVNKSGTGIVFHLRVDDEKAAIETPVAIVGDEIQVSLPQGNLACFRKSDLLDHAAPIWNN